ncbi:hypothetical protein [Sphingobium sp. BS19]|nr:hypothetical protein [Sphingobium sp. BS19]GLI99117.1 hypothetical protein Sbs19_29350 [Sphingobium sp. BS19]
MGTDWRTLTWWEYGALLWNWNVIHGGEPKAEPDVARLRNFMKAHSNG